MNSDSFLGPAGARQRTVLQLRRGRRLECETCQRRENIDRKLRFHAWPMGMLQLNARGNLPGRWEMKWFHAGRSRRRTLQMKAMLIRLAGLHLLARRSVAVCRTIPQGERGRPNRLVVVAAGWLRLLLSRGSSGGDFAHRRHSYKPTYASFSSNRRLCGARTEFRTVFRT